MKKAFIIGSSKGIGNSIKKKLSELKVKIIAPSSEELNTSNISNVKKYINKIGAIDYLILNTGGPPAKNFFSITEDEWFRYYNQLFLSFVLILQRIKIQKNGFIFLISSHTIKAPEDNLVLSNCYRVAVSSVFKTVSKLYSQKKVTCINIAPGPIKTKRLKNLVKDITKFERNLPLGRAGKPDEIGSFIKSIIINDIKYLNGGVLFFDGGLSKNLF
jgi:3-oxoacyl-[acyl-carrier protein] reductase